jgi:hypothetical protein
VAVAAQAALRTSPQASLVKTAVAMPRKPVALALAVHRAQTAGRDRTAVHGTAVQAAVAVAPAQQYRVAMGAMVDSPAAAQAAAQAA